MRGSGTTDRLLAIVTIIIYYQLQVCLSMCDLLVDIKH